MIKEFKEFISRGSVIDLAVGVIVGGAFSNIVSSLVNNVLMPLIGIILGGINFSKLSFKIGKSTIAYGMFLQNLVDFLIIAFCIFILVKFINKLSKLKKKSEPKEEKKEVHEETELSILKDIRNELKKKKK